jgi:predicted permease
VLLTLEVGLTVVLLIGAGLLMKSYARLRGADLGCLTQNVMKMDLNLPVARYSKLPQVTGFLEPLLERVRNTPGVKAAGYVFPVVPGDGYGGDNGFAIVEHPPLPLGKGQFAIHRWIDPGYFNATGIPILRGHTLDDNQQPGHETEVVVSNAFARQYFPNEDPLGKHLVSLLMSKTPMQIVGVVGDTRTEMGEPMKPMMYFPLYAAEDMNGATLVVRSDRDVTQFAMPIQRIVAGMDRDLPVSDIFTMDQVLGQNTLDASFNAELLAGFAVLSLLLSAAGLFGVLSYMVAQRTSEIGIRMALGAQREQVLGKMLGDGLKPALMGLVLGLAGSVGTVRLLESMLYETDKLDPMVFAAVGAVLLVVAAGACMAPAWRASRLDPMSALRTE